MEKRGSELPNTKKHENHTPTPEEIQAKDTFCSLFEDEPRYRPTDATGRLNITRDVKEKFLQAEDDDPEALSSAFQSARKGNLTAVFERIDVDDAYREVATPEVMIGMFAFAADRLEGDSEERQEQMKLYAGMIQKGKKIRGADDLTTGALEIVKQEYHFPKVSRRMLSLMPGIRKYAATKLGIRGDVEANFIKEAQIAEESGKLLSEIGASPDIVRQWGLDSGTDGLQGVLNIPNMSPEKREEWEGKIQAGESHYVSIRMTRRIVDAVASGELDFAALQRFFEASQEAQRAKDPEISFEPVEIKFLPPPESEDEGGIRVVIGGGGETSFNNLEVERLLPLAEIQNRLLAHGYESNDIRFVQSKLDDRTRRKYEGAGEIAPVYYGIVAKSRGTDEEQHESIFVVNPRGGQRNAAYTVNGKAFGGLDWQDILDNSKPEARDEGALALKHVGDIAERAILLMTNAGEYEREWMARQREKRRRMGGSAVANTGQLPTADEI